MSGNNKRGRGRGSNRRGRGGSVLNSPVTSGNENNEGNQETTSLPNSLLNLENNAGTLVLPPEHTNVLKGIDSGIDSPAIKDESTEKKIDDLLKELGAPTIQPETQSSEDEKKEESLTGLEASIKSLEKMVIETNASISNSTAEKKEEPNVAEVLEKEQAPTLDKASESVSKFEKVEEKEVTVEKDKENLEEEKKEQLIVPQQEQEKKSEEAALPAKKSDSEQPASVLDTIKADKKTSSSTKAVIETQPSNDTNKQAGSEEKQESNPLEVSLKQESKAEVSQEPSPETQSEITASVNKLDVKKLEEVKEEATAVEKVGSAVTGNALENPDHFIDQPFGAAGGEPQPSIFLPIASIVEKTNTPSEEVKNPDPNSSELSEEQNIPPILKATVQDPEEVEEEEEVVEHIGENGKPVNIPTVSPNNDVEGKKTTVNPAANTDPKPAIAKNGEKDAEKEKATKNQSLALSQKQQEQDEEKKKRKTSLIVGASVGLLAVGYAAALKFLSNRIKNIWFDRAMIAGTVITSVFSAVFLTKALIETKNISKRGNELNIDKIENNKKEVLEK